jgi:hypothetical protein
MNVIVDASDAIQVAIEILVDSPDIAIKKLSMALGQRALAIPRGENDVKQQLGVGIRHGEPQGNVSPLTRLRSHRRIITGGCAALHPRLFTSCRSAAPAAVMPDAIAGMRELFAESCMASVYLLGSPHTRDAAIRWDSDGSITGGGRVCVTSLSNMFQSLKYWIRRRRFREGRTISRFIARDVRRDILIVSAARIDEGIITGRVRTTNVLYRSHGLVHEPEFEPPRELRIEKMWDWTGRSSGGLPDGTSIVDHLHDSSGSSPNRNA